MSDDLVKRLREGATWDDDVAAADRIEELETKLAMAHAAGRAEGIQEAAIVARQALIDGAYIKRGSHQERPSSVMFLAETLVSNAIGSLIPAIAEINGEQP